MLPIRKLTPALLTLLAILIIPVSLRAQVEEGCDDLIGTYELTLPNGTSPVPNQKMTITPGCHDYEFVTAGGLSGHISPSSNGGYESTTTNGHHRVCAAI